MNVDLRNQIVLLTGAGGGIGRETALAFAREGAKLALSDVDTGAGEETVALARKEGTEAVFIGADVTDPNAVEGLVATTLEHFGRLDCAVNNAGVEHESRKLVDCTLDMWDRTLEVNLKGVWLCMKYEIPPMLTAGGGVIVNVSSAAGLGGAPSASPYAASKHGVVGLTRTAAIEYAKNGIRVNAVCPSYTRTEMVQRVLDTRPEMKKTLLKASPMGRLGEPEEVAQTILWLCSPRSSYVNGAAIPVDGGITAW